MGAVAAAAGHRISIFSPHSMVHEEVEGVDSANISRKTDLNNQIQKVAKAKIAQVDEALSSPDPKGTFMAVTNLSNAGFSTLEAASAFAPSIAKISGVFWSTFIIGEIAGAINLINAFIMLHEASKECPDTFQRVRLGVDFIFQFALSILMILTSLSLKVAALGSFGAFMTANPYILALLFLIPMLPTLCDVAKRFSRISHHDFVEGLDLTKLKKQLEKDEPIEIPEFFKIKSKDEILKKLETVEINWGHRAAKELMQLWLDFTESATLNRTKILRTVERLVEEQNRWKKAQMWKIYESFAMFAAAGLGLGAMGAANPSIMDGASSAVTAVGNALPTYPDLNLKLERNTPLVLEPLKLEDSEQEPPSEISLTAV